MPLFNFWSVEKQAVIRRQFASLGMHGELRMFCFVGQADKPNKAVFVQISEDRVTHGYFWSDDIKKPGRIPDTFDGWKKAVREHFLHCVNNVRVLPHDAIFFGFSENDIKASRDAYESAKQKEREEAEASEIRRQQEEAERKKASTDNAIQALANGNSVSGDSLVDVAKELGIELHPRTIGTIRKRVVSIRNGSASLRSGNQLPDGVWRALRSIVEACHSMVFEQDSVADELVDNILNENLQYSSQTP